MADERSSLSSDVAIDLIKDVGRMEAQIAGSVTHKEMMAQYTDLRKELTGKLDRQHDQVLDRIRDLVERHDDHLEQMKKDLVSQIKTDLGGMIERAVEEQAVKQQETEERAARRVQRAWAVGGVASASSLGLAAAQFFGLLK